jgi:hypothetical protein
MQEFDLQQMDWLGRQREAGECCGDLSIPQISISYGG